MRNKIKGILLGSIIGDTLGTPLSGFSKGHISSIFKHVNDYVDPAHGLKGNMERWKKPALYSSISQMIILLSYHLTSGNRSSSFSDIIRRAIDASEADYGIFRHPGVMGKKYIEQIKNTSVEVFAYPCAELSLIAIPFAYNEAADHEIISFCSILNRDISSITGALFFINLLKRIITTCESITLPDLAINELSSLQNSINRNPGVFFEKGINPDYILSSLEDFSKIFSGLKTVKTIESAEEIICSLANKKFKTPVKRGTVDHPLIIIPYSIILAHISRSNPAEILSTAANEGGAASVLCGLSGALCGALYGEESIPEHLVENLVNRRKILSIINAISSTGSDFMTDFLKNESLLTMKEIEEKNARLKHIKPRKKETKTKKDREQEITKHVVESWTKTDKAKWRRRLDKEKYE